MAKDNLGKTMTAVILGVMVAGILIAFLLPIPIEQVNNTNTTGWTSESQDLWGLYTLFFVLVPLIALIGYTVKVI